MKEIVGDLWDYYMRLDCLICITTNGVVRESGTAVCGRGCAKEATKNIPFFSRLLGEYILRRGNTAGIMKTGPAEQEVFVFPVKHNWRERADTYLIVESACALNFIAKGNPDTTFILPRPGCGNGRLWWADIKPLIDFLPDNVSVISKGKNS